MLISKYWKPRDYEKKVCTLNGPLSSLFPLLICYIPTPEEQIMDSRPVGGEGLIPERGRKSKTGKRTPFVVLIVNVGALYNESFRLCADKH